MRGAHNSRCAVRVDVPDGHRNVITRLVLRRALSSRFFQIFRKVDIADQLRQHKIGLEMKWVANDDNAAKRRILTTILGQCVVDTMRAYKRENHEWHHARSVTTRDVVKEAAVLMVQNELNGRVFTGPRATRG